MSEIVRPVKIAIAIMIAITPYAINAKVFVPYNSKSLLENLKQSKFYSAITSGTIIKVVYENRKYIIAIYINQPPDTGHENVGVVIFKNRQYSHDYSGDELDYCRVLKMVLACKGNFRDTDTNVPVADLIAGRLALLGGDLSYAYRGKKRYYYGK